MLLPGTPSRPVPSGSEPRHLLGELVELAAVLSPNLALLDEAEFSVAVFLPKALKCVHVLFGHPLHLVRMVLVNVCAW